jgi:demethylmenaquinone methyltransferase/2-methoxy-6-polyprenyl-1,4-benzoquinol methylase
MNRAMTFGIDKLWRRRAVRMVKRSAPSDIVDLATGTGDLAIALARMIPEATVRGIDLSEGMVAIGQRKVSEAGLSGRVSLSVGDCLDLPLSVNCCDAITIAYGVRNFAHLDKGYSEMLRVLRPGGMLCVIELSTPTNSVARFFYDLYTRYVIPTIGRVVSKDVRAYSYLPESIAAVPQGREMLKLMSDAGFTDTRYVPLTFGTCTIYTARCPR